MVTKTLLTALLALSMFSASAVPLSPIANELFQLIVRSTDSYITKSAADLALSQAFKDLGNDVDATVVAKELRLQAIKFRIRKGITSQTDMGSEEFVNDFAKLISDSYEGIDLITARNVLSPTAGQAGDAAEAFSNFAKIIAREANEGNCGAAGACNLTSSGAVFDTATDTVFFGAFDSILTKIGIRKKASDISSADVETVGKAMWNKIIRKHNTKTKLKKGLTDSGMSSSDADDALSRLKEVFDGNRVTLNPQLDLNHLRGLAVIAEAFSNNAVDAFKPNQAALQELVVEIIKVSDGYVADSGLIDILPALKSVEGINKFTDLIRSASGRNLDEKLQSMVAGLKAVADEAAAKGDNSLKEVYDNLESQNFCRYFFAR